MTWSTRQGAQTFNQIVLYGYPSSTDQITSALLSFSDGSTVQVGALRSATATYINLPTMVTSQFIKLSVRGVSSSTRNVGLGEIQVFVADPSK